MLARPCPEPMVLNNWGLCVCPKDYVINFTTKICEPICQNGYTWN